MHHQQVETRFGVNDYAVQSSLVESNIKRKVLSVFLRVILVLHWSRIVVPLYVPLLRPRLDLMNPNGFSLSKNE